MRVLLVDDHHLFRHGLKYLLADLEAGIDFCEADSLAAALALAQAVGPAPDLVLVDLHMPGQESMHVLTSIRLAFDASMVVVLSSEDDPEVILRAIEAGAAGYVPKSSTPKVLIAALRLVMAGGIYIPPPALRAFGSGARGIVPVPALRSAASAPAAAAALGAAPAQRDADSLSGRQMEVLLKAVQGKANKVIAREMQLSEGTVKAHLSAAFRALGVQNRTEAVFAAARMGLAPTAAAVAPPLARDRI